MQTQTTTAAMSTTAELLTAYNAITAYNTQEGKDLARAIIQGDTAGKLPTKATRTAARPTMRSRTS